MSKIPSIACPICNSENNLSSDAGKIIDCYKCGAPIFNDKRPANADDIKEYQKRIRVWGYEHQNVTEAQLKGHSNRLQARKQKQEQEKSSKQALTKLKAELEDWKKQCKTLKAEKDAAVKDQAERIKRTEKLQAALKSQEENYAQLTEKYEVLQIGVRSLQEEIETFRKQTDQHIRGAIQASVEPWNQLMQVKIGKDKEILEQFNQLLSSSSGKERRKAESVSEEATREDQVLNPDSFEQQVGSETLQKSSEKLEITVSQTEKANTENNATAESYTALTQKDAQHQPEWLRFYNSLADSQDIQRFKQTYSPQRLMVPSNMLEQHRAATDSNEPVFLEPVVGAGSSYWLLQGQNDISLLVIDRERFIFNGSNYRSIALCYNFNDHSAADFKYFKSNKYDLSTYAIRSPAWVVAAEREERWQLTQKGRIVFKRKPDTV